MRRKFKVPKRLHLFKHHEKSRFTQNKSPIHLPTNQHNTSNVYNIDRPSFNTRDHDIEQFL